MLLTISCDQMNYYDTNAVINVEDNLELSGTISAVLKISTSNTYLAGTADSISVIFIGDFASSGPHIIGSFLQGEKKSLTTTLDRKIGNLEAITFYNYGYDGWLPASVTCQIGNILYEMIGTRQWVDSLDPTLLKSTGDGYEPNDHEGLPAAASLQLSTFNKFDMYKSNIL